MTSQQPHPTTLSSLAEVPTQDLRLATNLGAVGLFVLDERNIRVRAGGERFVPATRYGPVRVNRIGVDFVAHYRRNERGVWKRVYVGFGDEVAYCAGTHTAPSRTVLEIVRTTLALAIAEWADANPHILAAAQHTAYGHDLAEATATRNEIAEELSAWERRVADIQYLRDAHAARWTRPPTPSATTAGSAGTIGSVVDCDGSAHYLVWTDDAAVACRAVGGLEDLPDTMLVDTVRAHLYDRDADTLAKVSAWHTTTYPDTSGALDAPEVARAVEVVGDRIGTGQFNQRRPVTVQTVAEQWSFLTEHRDALRDDQQPLREALDILVQGDVVRAAGHAQVLRGLVDHATAAADRCNAEAVASQVPVSPDGPETCRLIRQHLRRRSGREWSVTRVRGASGQIQIHVLPSERDSGDCMDRFDEAELARLLGLPAGGHEHGVSVGTSFVDRREYIARAMGLTPTESGTP